METNNSKGWIIAIVIVVIIVIAGVVVWMTPGQNQLPTTAPLASDNTAGSTLTPPPQDQTIVPKTVTVSLTDQGYSPSPVTINAGDTITFVNNSSAQMWVASDPHPTHTDYPGFDEKQAVGAGGSYSFTFNNVGTWGYHNHRNPSVKGTIVVQTVPAKS